MREAGQAAPLSSNGAARGLRARIIIIRWIVFSTASKGARSVPDFIRGFSTVTSSLGQRRYYP